jgi:hypothetical protein
MKNIQLVICIKCFGTLCALIFGLTIQHAFASSNVNKKELEVTCTSKEKCFNKQGNWTVKRSGKELLLRSKNSKITKFKNNLVDSDGRKEYIFERFIPEVNAFEVSFAGWEISATVLVDYATGKQLEIDSGLNEFSPDGKHYAHISCDLEINTSCIVEVFKWNTYNAADSVLRCKLPNVELAAPTWLDNQKVSIEYESSPRHTHPSINKNNNYFVSKVNNIWSTNLPCRP